MDNISFLRQIADNWMLLAMFGFFISAALWAFLPSQNWARRDASLIPFRNDEAPLTTPAQPSAAQPSPAQPSPAQPSPAQPKGQSND